MAAQSGDGALQLQTFLPTGGRNTGQTRPPTILFTSPSTKWLEEPELPSPEEILRYSPPPLLAIENDQIESKEVYLEKHYRMQRFEAVEPTRLAVTEFRRTPSMLEGDLAYIYTNVRIQGVVLTIHGAAARVSFSTERALDAPVDWANSKRLRQGSLVVLSPIEDGFRSKCLVATVAYRSLFGGLWPDVEADPPEPEETPPRVDLYISDWSEIDPNTRYYLLEAKDGYFESFRHTMTALQAAASEISLMDKYLLSNDLSKGVENKPVKARLRTVNALDKSQVAACEAIIGQQLSVVQGPPGTGKTHTTVVTIEEILSRYPYKPQKPVIVAAQSNHAVDQLLERCLKRDLAVGRLGGRTVSGTIEEHSLFKIRERSRGTITGIGLSPAAYQDFETARQVLELQLKGAFQGQQNYDRNSFRDAKIITPEQFDSLENDWVTSEESDPLLSWLGWKSFITSPAKTPHSAQKWKTKAGIDSEEEDHCKRRLPDPDKPIGPYISFTSKGPEPPVSRCRSLLRNKDLYKVKAQHREDVFNYMCLTLAQQKRTKLQESFLKFRDACHRLLRSRIDRDHRVITKTHIEIIGCTITGLSKYRRLLQTINPDILIIDEASEAMEGSISAALLPSLKHLALVGDHQQLTPRPITTILTEPVFALQVSLFERLVTQNSMPCQVLKIQRRMIPEIRQLVNLFYPGLRDHSSVLKREAINGIGLPLWWFDHAWSEQTGSGASGHSIANNDEADMIIGFTKHLISCGTPVEKVTILSCYTAQQELINAKLEAQNIGLAICKTVDSFQGCENDVIILSIVRSPHPGRRPTAGFVENIHRATVALSRARNAFYIFGNATNLQGSATWAPILDMMASRRGSYLPLVCPIHQRTYFVRSPEGWEGLGEACCPCDNHGRQECQMSMIPGCIVKKPVKMRVETPDKTTSRNMAPEENPERKTISDKKPGKRQRGKKGNASSVVVKTCSMTKLEKTVLDRVQSAWLSHGLPSSKSTDNTSSEGRSQDDSVYSSGTVYSSDYMIEVGYDACIEEFEELAVQARAEKLSSSSQAADGEQENAVEIGEDLIDFS
ncbi:hypothetical protein BB8028_0004g13350 [Beauveria bassiana]|uniref:Helicase required for RNAi-mediated heterochromatin assembly 1 n=1 Tax=Beauveria bassiana TaxID=176275 RepID=A0A2S7YE26_BEABA|nr:hypothetical protein BB8028_0004g13350 [Beauveria bassiana]